MLAQALKDKINEKELAQITVSELTTMCGIKRQTFYYHFTDILQENQNLPTWELLMMWICV